MAFICFIKNMESSQRAIWLHLAHSRLRHCFRNCSSRGNEALTGSNRAVIQKNFEPHYRLLLKNWISKQALRHDSRAPLSLIEEKLPQQNLWVPSGAKRMKAA